MMDWLGQTYLYGTIAVRRVFRDERGANLVEYAFLIGLIAVVAIAGVTLFGNELADLWTSNGDTVTNPNP